MKECDNRTIGERIRYYRMQQGLSQKELGIRCGFKDNVAGEQIRHFESGKRVPKKAIIVKLAEVLSINPISLEIGILSDYSYEEIMEELIIRTDYHCGDILRKRKEPFQYGKMVIYVREKGRRKEKDKVVLLTKAGCKTMVKWKLRGYEKVGHVLPESYDFNTLEKNQKDGMKEMNKIVIKENGILTYKEVTREDLISLQIVIEEIIKAHKFSIINANDVCVSVENGNGGYIIINIMDYTCIKSISQICSVDFGEDKLSTKEAISLNITNILDNLENILTREKNKIN